MAEVAGADCGPSGGQQMVTQTSKWSKDVPVHHVAAKAGDCILFTEVDPRDSAMAVLLFERRTVFYKYVPYGMHHGDAGYGDDPELTERQRAIVQFQILGLTILLSRSGKTARNRG